MKEHVPENYPNLHELSEERKKLHGLSDEDVPLPIQKIIESAQNENKEKAKGVIENLGGIQGGLSRAKEKMKQDKVNAAKSEVVDIESIEDEMGEEYKKIENLHAGLEDISYFILSRQRESQTDPYARKNNQSVINLSLKEKTVAEKQIAEISFRYPEVSRAFDLISYKKDLAEELGREFASDHSF